MARGVAVADRAAAAKLLRDIGYCRLTGYLCPFRLSERFTDEEGRERIRVTSGHHPGAAVDDAARLVDFGRGFRLLVLEAVERIEVALRTQLGHTIGRLGSFAHEDAATY